MKFIATLRYSKESQWKPMETKDVCNKTLKIPENMGVRKGGSGVQDFKTLQFLGSKVETRKCGGPIQNRKNQHN